MTDFWGKVSKVGIIRLISIPLGLLISIILSRALGPELFGLYAWMMALLPVLSLPVSGGLPQLLVRNVAEYTHHNSKKNLRAIIKFSYLWTIFFAFFLIFLVYIFGHFLVDDIKRLELLKVAIWIIPFYSILSVSAGILRGFNKPIIADLMQQLCHPIAVLIILTFIFFYSSLNVTNMLSTQIAAYAVSCFILIFFLSKLYPKDLYTKKESYRSKEWFIALLPFSMTVLVTTLTTQIGILMLGIYSTDTAVAGLRIAERGVQFVAMSLGVIGQLSNPYIVNYYQSGDIKSLQILVKKVARICLMISIPLALVFIFFGKLIIGVLFGADYIELAYLSLVILVIAQIINIFCGPVINILSMTGHAGLMLIGQSVGGIATTVLCFFLIPIYNAAGAAISIAIGIVIWNVLLIIFVKNNLKIDPSAL
jgi:O-antigen/teichoic acid export membrane protein